MPGQLWRGTSPLPPGPPSGRPWARGHMNVGSVPMWGRCHGNGTALTLWVVSPGLVEVAWPLHSVFPPPQPAPLIISLETRRYIWSLSLGQRKWRPPMSVPNTGLWVYNVLFSLMTKLMHTPCRKFVKSQKTNKKNHVHMDSIYKTFYFERQ